jgi:hypothetical protein
LQYCTVLKETEYTFWALRKEIQIWNWTDIFYTKMNLN